MVYIGARFQMDMGSMYLPEEWIEGLLALFKSFSKVGKYKTALFFLSLLGLMAATLQLEYTHLHMHPI